MMEWDQEKYLAKQQLAKPSRFYGDLGTIHGTTHLDVEVHNGEVVSVWFRCTMLPFEVHEVDTMRATLLSTAVDVPDLTGVELLDHDVAIAETTASLKQTYRAMEE